jgi:hypothetical protein
MPANGSFWAFMITCIPLILVALWPEKKKDGAWWDDDPHTLKCIMDERKKRK